MGRFVRTFMGSAACVVVLTVASGLTAMADVDQPTQNPTTGHQGSDAGNSCGNANAMTTPGNAASATGSPFNPNVTKFYAGNQNSASLAHSNSTAAVSQYDVACLRLSSH
jgi:hypothetical protein